MAISINGIPLNVTSELSPGGRRIELATESIEGAAFAGDISALESDVAALQASDTAQNAQIASLNAQLVVVDMDTTADVTGGGTTQTVGFQLRDAFGALLSQQMLLQFAVFQDANATVPAANATLNTASAGTIVAGGGSPALIVLTSASGKFTCTLTDLVDETVYLACATSFGSEAAVCTDIDSVAFSA